MEKRRERKVNGKEEKEKQNLKNKSITRRLNGGFLIILFLIILFSIILFLIILFF